MTTKIDIHPTAAIALKVISISLFAGFALLSLKRIMNRNALPSRPQLGAIHGGMGVTVPLLLPIVFLDVPEDSHETVWSKALADFLLGVAESPTKGGRIDVETNEYAIEVERLGKWHEAIGQAAHYALTAKKRPVAAFIVSDSEDGAMNGQKIRLIEETCLSKEIKVVLLRSKRAAASHSPQNR